MDIDWSKAPEGATHFDTAEYRTKSFMKLEDGAWYYWPPMSSEPRWSYLGADGVDSDTGPFVAIPTGSEWNGEGLPPVGTVCEWLDPDSGRWIKSVIAFLSSWVIVVRDVCPHPDGPVDIAFDLNEIHPKFRPIRTPEQIAAEERDSAVAEMTEASLYGHYAFTKAQAEIACRALYDAGYRKQVAP